MRSRTRIATGSSGRRNTCSSSAPVTTAPNKIVESIAGMMKNSVTGSFQMTYGHSAPSPSIDRRNARSINVPNGCGSNLETDTMTYSSMKLAIATAT